MIHFYPVLRLYTLSLFLFRLRHKPLPNYQSQRKWNQWKYGFIPHFPFFDGWISFVIDFPIYSAIALSDKTNHKVEIWKTFDRQKDSILWRWIIKKAIYLVLRGSAVRRNKKSESINPRYKRKRRDGEKRYLIQDILIMNIKSTFRIRGNLSRYINEI